MKSVWISLLLILYPVIVVSNPQEEGKSFAGQIHERGMQDKSHDLNAMQQQLSQKTEHKHQVLDNEILQKQFEQEFDTGKKEDTLKSYWGQKNVERAKHKAHTEPGLGETEHLLKQKNRFTIAKDDALFKTYEEVSKAKTKDIPYQHPPSKTQKLEPQIYICRQSVPPQYQRCVKRLVVRAIPQEPLVKTVTAYFAARCYNLVTYAINLKTGAIQVSQCENPGPKTVWVDNPIGEPDYPDRTTVELLNRQHFSGDGGVDFRSTQMNPSYANGFTASFTAFQPKTGRKHDSNKNHVRGGTYTWKITMPRKPIIERRWEGCEDLERKTIEENCELVEEEKQEINETRTIPNYGSHTESHWSKHQGYLCGGGRDINSCEPYIKERCEQIDSKCVAFKDKHCIEYENTFRCGVPNYAKSDGLSFNQGQLSFLEGHVQAAQAGYPASDFAESIAYFNALTEMGKTMQDGLGGVMGDPNNPSVFKGNCRQCRVTLGSFVRDCCKLKGILQGLLGRCNEEEKKLAIATLKQKRCVKIEGRYCHKKCAKICVEKRDSYCCYGSELARIIQEIGHQQLNIPWGDAKNPNCGSLTASQLSQLNFDTPYAQQKLSEILVDVQISAQDKFKRVQEAVSAAKNIQAKVQDMANQNTMLQEKAQKQVKEQQQKIKVQQ